MIERLRTHPVRWAAGTVVVLAGLAWLAFGYFGVHTLFVDDVVDEAAPVFEAAVPAAADPVDATPVSDDSDTATESDDAGSASADGRDDMADNASGSAGDTTGSATDEPGEIVTEVIGTFVGDAHPTVGTASVLGNGSGQRFLRFEGFETDNGPDLNVYLVNSSTGDVSDFVDLGDLKGNIGDQNYEIPADVDLDRYDTVVIWCVRFGVGFGSATLTAS